MCVGLETGQTGTPKRRSAQASILSLARSPTHCLPDIASPTPRMLKPYDQFLTICLRLSFQIRCFIQISAFCTYFDRFNLQTMSPLRPRLWYRSGPPGSLYSFVQPHKTPSHHSTAPENPLLLFALKYCCSLVSIAMSSSSSPVVASFGIVRSVSVLLAPVRVFKDDECP